MPQQMVTVKDAALQALVDAWDRGERDRPDLVKDALDAGVTLADVQRACWDEHGSL
jgi:hypothetical protein